MSDDIVSGNSRTRIVTILSAVGGLALFVSLPWIADLAASAGIHTADPNEAMAQLAFRYKLISVVGAIPLVALALVYARRGFAIMRARAYPPSGMTVPWSVRRRRGWPAMLMGLSHLVLAALGLLLATVGFWFWPR